MKLGCQFVFECKDTACKARGQHRAWHACRMGVDASVSAGMYTNASLMIVDAITSCAHISGVSTSVMAEQRHGNAFSLRETRCPYLKRCKTGPAQTVTRTGIQLDIKEENATQNKENGRVCSSDDLRIAHAAVKDPPWLQMPAVLQHTQQQKHRTCARPVMDTLKKLRSRSAHTWSLTIMNANRFSAAARACCSPRTAYRARPI